MPWELGYFDGYNGKVAIVPIVESASSDFKEQEYLSLYPYIDEAGIKGSSEKALWVNEENKSCNLRKWIN